MFLPTEQNILGGRSRSPDPVISTTEDSVITVMVKEPYESVLLYPKWQQEQVGEHGQHPDVEPGPAVEDVWVQLQVRSWLQPRPREITASTTYSRINS